jgi:hypothetical protein
VRSVTGKIALCERLALKMSSESLCWASAARIDVVVRRVADFNADRIRVSRRPHAPACIRLPSRKHPNRGGDARCGSFGRKHARQSYRAREEQSRTRPAPNVPIIAGTG